MSECIAAKWTTESRSVGLLHLRGESGVTDDGVGPLRSLSLDKKGHNRDNVGENM